MAKATKTKAVVRFGEHPKPESKVDMRISEMGQVFSELREHFPRQWAHVKQKAHRDKVKAEA